MFMLTAKHLADTVVQFAGNTAALFVLDLQ